MVEKSAGMKWVEVDVPLEDPGGTHELFVVYRGPGGDEPAPFKLNWIEFHGAGVRADIGDSHEPGRHPEHPHDHAHGQ